MRKLLLTLLAGLVPLLAAGSAQAIVIPGCGDFTIFADRDVDLENGTLLLEGNIFLRNPVGTVKVGAKNRIKGTITANKIFLGTSAVVDECVANEIQGTKGVCTTSTVGPGSFNPAPACLAFPPVAPEITNTPVSGCVLTAAALTVLAGQEIDLPNGFCVRNLILREGTEANPTILRLAAGAVVNAFSFTAERFTEIRRLGPGPRPLLNVLNKIQLAPGTEVHDVIFRSQGAAGQIAIRIGLNSLIKDALFIAPFGVVHVHGGSLLEDVAIVANKAAIEPVTFAAPPPPPDVCECKIGFHPQGGPVACVPD
jgi:hypothetical protein